MGTDSDDIISLPSPPPPRPSARREAIETALRRFDGVEEPHAEGPSRQRPWPIQWAVMHRRPAGALVAAALIMVVGIPAVQVALRDRSPDVVVKAREPGQVRPDQDAADCSGSGCAGQGSPAPAAPRARPDTAATEAKPSPVQDAANTAAVAVDRIGLASESPPREPMTAPAPAMIAPPGIVAAAPPPPPPAEPQAETSGADNIVVTGSRVPARNLAKQDGYAESKAEQASALATMEAHAEFLSRLQVALRANDRRAIMKLTGLPLRVILAGESRIYRSSREVERDFDRIFTADVRSAVLNLNPDTLASRDGGKLKGNGQIWFGCSSKFCPSDASIRIWEVNP